MNTCKKATIYTGETVGLFLSMYEDDGLTPVDLTGKVVRVVIASGSDIRRLYQNPMPLNMDPIPDYPDLQYSPMTVQDNKILINFQPDDTKDLEGVYDVQVMEITPSTDDETVSSVIGVFSNVLEINYAVIGKI